MSDGTAPAGATPKGEDPDRARALAVASLSYPLYSRAARRVLAEQRLRLRNYLEDAGKRNVYSVRGRVKPLKSIVDRIGSGRYPSIDKFPDIAAMRIVVYGPKDVEVIEAFFRMQEYRNDVRVHRTWNVTNKGYRARHLQVEVLPSYTYSSYSIMMEVQIQTLCDSVFNTVSRAYWYKHPTAAPAASVRERLREFLGRADEVVEEVQEHCEAAHAAVPDEEASAISFRVIVREALGEDMPVWDAAENLIQLKEAGYSTNGQVREIFRNSELRAKVDELKVLDSELVQEGSLHSWYVTLVRSPSIDFVSTARRRLEEERSSGTTEERA